MKPAAMPPHGGRFPPSTVYPIAPMAADFPTLSASDAIWLQRLAGACEHLPQRMPSFLQQHFFNEAAGRALILQPARRFGYYYLKRAVYERPECLSAEIKCLMDLCALIARLRAHHVLYLFDQGGPRAEPMFFLSDLFVEPAPATAHLLLNRRGDYTADPETINNADDELIYRGVRLDGEIYDFVHEAMRGIFTMTDDARAQVRAGMPLAQPAPAAEDAGAAHPASTATDETDTWLLRRPRWQSIARHAAVALVAGLAGYALQDHEPVAAAPSLAQARPAGVPTPHVDLTAPPAPPEPAATSAPAAGAEAPLYGVDVSKWNGRAGADVLRAPALSFAFARASDGLTPDPSFAANWKRMAERGLVRGAYHFFSLQSDPAAQARHLVQALEKRSGRDLCAAVDFEECSLPAKDSRPAVKTVQTALLAHLQYLEQRLGCRPILYTNLATGNYYLNDARFARYPLWIADWVSGSAPVLPKAWSAAGYRFWQRSAAHVFAEAPQQHTDFDVFAGSKEQLAAMLPPQAADRAAQLQLVKQAAMP